VVSIDTLELDLDERRTVIVGPNWSGKTKVRRLPAVIGSAPLRSKTPHLPGGTGPGFRSWWTTWRN
jgi:recombinational DNA repair ATPase RecF